MEEPRPHRTRIGLVQLQLSDDPGVNLRRALGLAGDAAGRGASIICLPELYRTRYFPQDECSDLRTLAETIPGESTRAFSTFARERGVVVIVPVFEQGESGAFHNTAVVIDSDGGILPPYRKVHVPHDPLFYEKHYFIPGDGYRVYDTSVARFAVLICYDQWFPEAARAVALRGAEIIFYPTAIGWPRGEQDTAEGDWQEAWETVQRGHAIANGIPVATVNRSGKEGDLLFWGGSFATDAFGKVVARAGEGEEVLVADLDLSLNRAVREGWGFFRNRRPDTYGILTDPVVHEYPVPAGIPDTPRKRGFSMPAEWEPHDSTWLAWPHDPETFGDLPAVEEAYVAIIAALAPGERVNLLVRDRAMEERVRGLLADARISTEQLSLVPLDYADAWIRDYGPTFVVNREKGGTGMVAWDFNAWGGKYPALARDRRVPSCLNAGLALPLFRPGIVLEGGSIDVNGMGSLLTTEQCLRNPNRNPGLAKEEIGSFLREFVGAENIIWLRGGIAGDDTDGHVDDVARFVDPATIVYALSRDREDENSRVLRANLKILRKARDRDDRPFTLVPLPMPRRMGEEVPFPASYLNFYIGNRVVLVPAFSDPDDDRALEILAGLFPSRQVVGIDCRALVAGLGAVHCVTQQQPRAP
ncbi:MAG TPA: agmatine deiminase family protein [Methanomicrobiales archaeon]|nr:agmatine deiminase family protein [Methanomicrobiales archaeon]